ncbi:hypothetical protein ACFOE1_16235 [Agromyces mediolanus]|uniref:DUF2076 domain-containing protein n=1 Tax=Agromyces mediolanus TaxID=41986 RepID=A0A918FBH8_AGRME|nr:hypothetical protein [Agromyces mediolanus]GGR24063.1 hypothetical protein GCM10010196_17330 [Agromyces mediolanus]GLJ71008.1 hypothetical protein GCM10017583_02630 [Agromyces mediolanus]
MGFFDRLFGAPEERPAAQPAPRARALSDDELAVERYRYLLRTAPPESIEQVHAEAFAKLTPEQRQQVFQALSEQAPAGERLVSDEPSALARAATRQELRAPGSMERAFQGGGRGAAAAAGGPSFGQMLGGSMLGTIAGVVVGSAIAQAFLPDPGAFEAGGEGSADQGGDAGADQGGDAGSVDASGADQGGFGDGGFGDFGGGDFGGGDFGF